MNTKTAFDLLKSSGNARDAKIILNHILKSKDFLLPEKELNARENLKVWAAARKLKLGMPVAKITGVKEFFGLEFETGHGTLDPRPDSETLIYALEKHYTKDAEIKILDCGTGTGCLLAAALTALPKARGMGIDISHSAVRCSGRNMIKLNLFDRAEIKRRDFKKPLAQKFDCVISNPPYIPVGDKRVDKAATFDPDMALYAGIDGLDAYLALAASVPEMLNIGGKVFLEIGIDQADKVREIFETSGFKFIELVPDLSAIPRVLVFEK